MTRTTKIKTSDGDVITFEQRNSAWVCSSAPGLRLIRLKVAGKTSKEVKEILFENGIQWDRVSENADDSVPDRTTVVVAPGSGGRVLRKQSDGQYDFQVRCVGDETTGLMMCKHLSSRRVEYWQYGYNGVMDWCAVRRMSPIKSKWSNCQKHEPVGAVNENNSR